MGEIVNVGHAQELNEPVYLVQFEGCVIGCLELEIIPAPDGLLPETQDGAMNAMASPPLESLVPAGGQVLDLMQRRLERALRQRGALPLWCARACCAKARISASRSPCCSRNVDPEGGVIDIALLEPCMLPRQAAPVGWRLHSRDHAGATWVGPQRMRAAGPAAGPAVRRSGQAVLAMIYLDHNATTPPAPEVVEAMLAVLRGAWANASSQHGPGQQARRVLAQARAGAARALGCKPAELVFTSGATEANQMAMRGLLGAAAPGPCARAAEQRRARGPPAPGARAGS